MITILLHFIYRCSNPKNVYFHQEIKGLNQHRILFFGIQFQEVLPGTPYPFKWNNYKPENELF